MGIRSKLLQVQSDLKAPKNRVNSFGKYKYRSAEDILEAVKPLIHNEGLTQTISDEIISVGERIYVKAIVTLYDIESEETLSTTAFARESNEKKGFDESQLTGSTSSYARKYALNGMYAIDDTEDADGYNNGSPKKTEATEQIEKISEAEVTKLLELASRKGMTEEKVKAAALKSYRIEDLRKLSKKALKELSERLGKLDDVDIYKDTPFA